MPTYTGWQRSEYLLSKGKAYPSIETDTAWIPPVLPGCRVEIHPILAWWAILFTLSLLARYHPDRWLRSINVDKSPDAVTVEHILNIAAGLCPSLTLLAIRQVTGA